MTYEDYRKQAERDSAKGFRYMITVYLFLGISALFFVLLFTAAPRLEVAGCAILCDAAALVYLLRAMKHISPISQTRLARACAAAPSESRLYELAAALEVPRKAVTYTDGTKALFCRAFDASKGTCGISREQVELLADVLNRRANVVCRP